MNEVRLRLRPGLAKRLREARSLPSEEAQARLVGVDRTTLRRVDDGAQPSATFIALFCRAFGLGLGEAFEIVSDDQPAPDLAVSA
ncbi:helix-turn-helix domain-containing protein [Cellulosimicrobium sp. 22601]|uniref:helix-turn-helix domain-containing protein n=1 Tax=unclassified Cellulosimicrobium TaxID=2624466 RepID=UPI003F84B902